MKREYRIVDDFQVPQTEGRVLVLDREYEFVPGLLKNVAVIDGKEYSYNLNSIRRWVIIKSRESFKGKTVTFE